eukprot:1140266-Pelagomonas_calceolata.AAC.8
MDATASAVKDCCPYGLSAAQTQQLSLLMRVCGKHRRVPQLGLLGQSCSPAHALARERACAHGHTYTHTRTCTHSHTQHTQAQHPHTNATHIHKFTPACFVDWVEFVVGLGEGSSGWSLPMMREHTTTRSLRSSLSIVRKPC